jgi:hypothetical protein
MKSNTLRTAGLALAGLALTALPAFADHDRGRREGHSSGRAEQARPADSARPAPRVEQRQVAPPRFENRGYDVRRNDGWRNNAQRNGWRYDNRRYFYAPRIIRPSIVNVSPFRPYFYRYRPAVTFYYGSGYYGYNYGAPPAAYLSVLPGHLYGGVRITDAPGDAQVFADGYYMGVVDDFDGIFQHMNLEAGPHHIEVVEPGFEPIAFDVNVQPGETTTFRANLQPAQPYPPYEQQ